MQKNRFALLLICLSTATACVIAILATVKVLATNSKLWFEEREIKTDAYAFPGTPEKDPEKWAEFTSHQEMVDACTIPEDILKEMSTDGLIETCLSYPLFGDMMLYNSSYLGFLSQIETFSGLKELLNRENTGEALCKLYYGISLDNVLANDIFPTYRLRYLEYIIAQPEILAQLNFEQKQELLNYAIDLAKAKEEKYPDIFSTIPSDLIIERIICQ